MLCISVAFKSVNQTLALAWGGTDWCMVKEKRRRVGVSSWSRIPESPARLYAQHIASKWVRRPCQTTAQGVLPADRPPSKLSLKGRQGCIFVTLMMVLQKTHKESQEHLIFIFRVGTERDRCGYGLHELSFECWDEARMDQVWCWKQSVFVNAPWNKLVR